MPRTPSLGPHMVKSDQWATDEFHRRYHVWPRYGSKWPNPQIDQIEVFLTSWSHLCTILAYSSSVSSVSLEQRIWEAQKEIAKQAKAFKEIKATGMAQGPVSDITQNPWSLAHPSSWTVRGGQQASGSNHKVAGSTKSSSENPPRNNVRRAPFALVNQPPVPPECVPQGHMQHSGRRPMGCPETADGCAERKKNKKKHNLRTGQ